MNARKLAELLKNNQLRSVYQGDHGLRTLKELVRSDLTITRDLSRGPDTSEGQALVFKHQADEKIIYVDDVGSAFSCCETRRKNDLPRPQREKPKR